MQETFFRKENIDNISAKLIKQLKNKYGQVKTDPKSIKIFKDFVEGTMTRIFDSNIDKKPKNLSMPDFITKLNEVTLKKCDEIYQKKFEQKKQNTHTRNDSLGKRKELGSKKPNADPMKDKFENKDVGQLRIERDKDIFPDASKRRPIIRRAEFTSGIKDKNDKGKKAEKEFSGMIDGDRNGHNANAQTGFAPFAKDFNRFEYKKDGTVKGYVSAFGTYVNEEMEIKADDNDGNEFKRDNNNLREGKEGDKEDLKLKALSLQRRYDDPAQQDFINGGREDNDTGFEGFNSDGMVNDATGGFGSLDSAGNGSSFSHISNGDDADFSKQRDVRDNFKDEKDNNKFRNDKNTGRLPYNPDEFARKPMKEINFCKEKGKDTRGGILTKNNVGREEMDKYNKLIGDININNKQFNDFLGNSQDSTFNKPDAPFEEFNDSYGQQTSLFNNQTNATESSKLTEQDMKLKLNQTTQERSSMIDPKFYNKPFNPMQSPHQQSLQQSPLQSPLQSLQQPSQQSQANFLRDDRKKSSAYDFSNMNTDDVMKYIDSSSKTTNNSIKSIELRDVKNMNIQQIDELINKLKSLNKPEEPKEEVKTKPKTDKKPTIKDETKKNKQETVLTINPENLYNPEQYSDYLIELVSKLHGVTEIILQENKLPYPVLNIEHNTLTFIYDGDLKEVEIESANYTIIELIQVLQSAFSECSTNIKINLLKNNKIVIEDNKNKFDLMNDENSVLRYLGFTKDKYESKNTYTSNNENEFITKLYMYIDNFDRVKPFAVIDLLDANKSYSKKFDKPVALLEDLIIKFKKEETKEDKLVDFNKKTHELVFKIVSSKKILESKASS